MSTHDSEEDCPHCQEEAQELAMHAKHDEIAKRLNLRTRAGDKHRADWSLLRADCNDLLAEVARLEGELAKAIDWKFQQADHLMEWKNKTVAAGQQRDRALAALAALGRWSTTRHIMGNYGTKEDAHERIMQAISDAEAQGGGV